MGGGASLQVMKAQGSVKKDPKAALVMAEEMLEKDPHGIAANGLLRDAAAALTMTETVGFALETMRDAEPKNTKILHELARHYVASDQAGEGHRRLRRHHGHHAFGRRGDQGRQGRGGAGVDADGRLGPDRQGGHLLPRRAQEQGRGSEDRAGQPAHQKRGRHRYLAGGAIRALQREPEQPRRGAPDRQAPRAEG